MKKKLSAVTGMARKRDSLKAPMVVGDEADWAQRTNLISVRGGADSGRVIPTANQMKTANVAAHAAELAGLGVLAKPSIDELRGKKVDERKKAKMEVAGLGILAAPSALSLAHSAWQRGRGLAKAAAVLPMKPPIANPAALKGRAAVLTQGVKPTPPAGKPKFDLAALKAAYGKSGMKPPIGSAANLPLKKIGRALVKLSAAAYRPPTGPASSAMASAFWRRRVV